MKSALLLQRSHLCCFILKNNPTYRKKETTGGAVGKSTLMETEEEVTKGEGISDGPPAVPS